jgi:LysM repeat protein
MPTAAAEGDGHDRPEDESAPEPSSQTPLPVLDDAARSPDPTVCPFFRFERDGSLVAPLPVPDAGNRCAAIGAPRPQSERQQELVCLRAAHTDCPRYLKGALAIGDPAAARRSAAVPRATLAALLILVLSAGISFGFVVQRGGIELPAAAPGPTSTAIGLAPSPSDEATIEPTPEPTEAATVEASSAAPSLEPTPSPSPSPEPTPSLEPSPEPTPSPTLEPTPKPTKEPRSDRYKLLDPCPDKPDCWIYVVRSGDNLYSIANYFGIPLRVIYDWNPRYPGARLRVGDDIRMPPPRR